MNIIIHIAPVKYMILSNSYFFKYLIICRSHRERIWYLSKCILQLKFILIRKHWYFMKKARWHYNIMLVNHNLFSSKLSTFHIFYSFFDVIKVLSINIILGRFDYPSCNSNITLVCTWNLSTMKCAFMNLITICVKKMKTNNEMF